MNKKGFTLIELLIVIAILGILATALLAGIDPLEQFNKATDAGRFSKVREMYGAAQRVGLNGVSVPTGPAVPVNMTADTSILSVLSGEIKASVTTSTADRSAMYYAGVSSDDGIKFAFCYRPVSKSNLKVANIASDATIRTDGTMDTSAPTAGNLICIY